MKDLQEYNKKRNFKNTTEPKGTKDKKEGKLLHFVVQRHHASHLHYDFRLEMGGTLKSWAVPKGPSLNPTDKRLAVHVEDHPLSYADFEGTIPIGNYGAGTVTIFDYGTYEAIEEENGEKELLKQLKAGSIKIKMTGKILKGEFALVRMKGEREKNWLLIKHKDNYATTEDFDAEDLVKEKFEPPMLATLATTVSEDGEWVFERKHDGYRALALISKNKTQLLSRNENDFSTQFKALMPLFESIDREVILDGEIVVEDSSGNQSFGALQRGTPFAKKQELIYYAFDLLALDGNDLRNYTLMQRKELLKLLIDKISSEQLRYTEELEGSLDEVMKKAEKLQWEGVIAKEKDSLYRSSKRSSLWRKIKLKKNQEAIIVGYTKSEKRPSTFGALVLAVMESKELRYIGNCGTGFTDKQLSNLAAKFKKIKITDKPFDKNVKVANESKVIWLKPQYIAEVAFSEWTADERMRHPVFIGLREDKKIKDIKKVETLEDKVNEKVLKIKGKEIKLTNQNKVLWPEENFTKGDLVNFYDKMNGFILPHIKDMPISLNRFPNGIHKSSFFQKDFNTDQIPSWIRTEAIYSDSADREVDYLICNDRETLLYLANLASIEINPWLSTYKKAELPVFAVVDLDPNGVSFDILIEVAQAFHALMEEIAIPAFIKTSGSEGLHIFLHLGQKYDYEIARNFVQLLCEKVHEQFPEITSLERSKSKRKNKIYLDYMQNSRGKTVVAPYSVRPKPGATVSTPLHWKELDQGITIQDFTMESVLHRVKHFDDPWKTLFRKAIDLKKAITKF